MDNNNAVLNTIQMMTNQIFNSIDSALIKVLDKLVFLDTEMLSEQTFQPFTTKMDTAMKIIAESIMVGYILYYLIRYLISRITSNSKEDLENPLVFFLKITLVSIAILYSKEICRELINFNNYISKDLHDAIDPSGYAPTFANLLKRINESFLSGEESINIFSIDGIFKGFVSFGTLNITVTFALRYVLIKVLIIIAPIAFVFRSFTKTEKLFSSWLKTFISLLLIQHYVSIVLLLGKVINMNITNTFNQIAYIGIIYALTKSFNIFEKIFGGVLPDVQVSFPFR